MNKILPFILIICFGCSLMTKKDDFRRVNKKGEIAGEYYLLGEKYRRAKAYSRSLNEYLKAAKIYRQSLIIKMRRKYS